MSNTIIRVENLSKKYIIAHQQEGRHRRKTLRDVIVDRTKSIRSKILSQTKDYSRKNWREEFWALENVCFEIKQGDRVGIIGRNGAGKSTLLKILSRITEPSMGRISIKGSVASLLEVGTGFHPELTGRENIYLNGAILGMRKVEIKQKFDEIVDFAEVEKFLDTPVKRYSSGMYVRLAFAVAAHLEPEILVVDEVLAVGDASFQKKCLGKMEKVAEEGRTILFVSHNMSAISTLTQWCILLNKGKVEFNGATEDAVAKYLALSYKNNTEWCANKSSDNPMQIMKATVTSGGASASDELNVTADIYVTVEYEVRHPTHGAVVAVIVHAWDGALLFSTEDTDTQPHLFDDRKIGYYRSTVTIPGGWLSEGEYLIRLGCGIPGQDKSFDNVEALSFKLVDTGNHLTRGHRCGYFLPTLSWSVNTLSRIEI